MKILKLYTLPCLSPSYQIKATLSEYWAPHTTFVFAIAEQPYENLWGSKH